MLLKNNSLILLILLLTGCKQMPQLSVPELPGLGARKVEVQQGNVITQEMLDKLQPGMTRNQVRFVLGTPLLVDPFRSDRWDYVYTMNQAGQRVEQRQLKVFFQDDKLLRYEGDVVAGAKAGAKPADKSVVQPVVKPVAAPAPPAVTVKPAAPVPAGAGAADIGKPQLRMAPAVGEAGPPAAVPSAADVTPVPREPEATDAPPLDTPPLPRLLIPAEPPAQPAQQPVTKPTVKPAEKLADKPVAGRGFFGRMVDAITTPVPRTTLGEERTPQPGSAPPSFVEIDPAPKKP